MRSFNLEPNSFHKMRPHKTQSTVQLQKGALGMKEKMVNGALGGDLMTLGFYVMGRRWIKRGASFSQKSHFMQWCTEP
jgi:hypothetical protein